MGLAWIGQLLVPEPVTFKSTFIEIFLSFIPIGVSISLIILRKSHLIVRDLTT